MRPRHVAVGPEPGPQQPKRGPTCFPMRQSPQDGLVGEGCGAQLRDGAWGGLEFGSWGPRGHCPDKRHCLSYWRWQKRQMSRHAHRRWTLWAPTVSSLGQGCPNPSRSRRTASSRQPRPAGLAKQASFSLGSWGTVGSPSASTHRVHLSGLGPQQRPTCALARNKTEEVGGSVLLLQKQYLARWLF